MYKKLFVISFLALMLIGGAVAMTEEQFKNININCNDENWIRTNMFPSYIIYPNQKSYVLMGGNVYIGLNYKSLNSNYNVYNVTRQYINIGTSNFWRSQILTDVVKANSLFRSTSKSKTKDILVKECFALKSRQQVLLNQDINLNNLNTW